MSLENFKITTRPNNWKDIKHARSFYDVFDKRTGEKYRFSASELLNNIPRVAELLGEQESQELSQAIIEREKQIQSSKEEYLDLFDAIKQRYDSGMRIPRSWYNELEDKFGELFNMDINIGRFSDEEEDDTQHGLIRQHRNEEAERITPAMTTASRHSTYTPQKTNASFRTPEAEAPHSQYFKNIGNQLVEDDDYYEGMELKRAIVKSSILLRLAKDDAGTAGPVGISSVGYMNPVFSKPMKRKRKKI